MTLIYFLMLMVVSLGIVLLALRHSLTALYVALGVLFGGKNPRITLEQVADAVIE